MSKMSREKGKRGEREVVTMLKDLLGDGYVFKRNLLDQCHDGGMDILGLPHWAIEVKNYKEATPSLINGWWAQTVDEKKKASRHPVLFWKQSRRPWVVVVSGNHLISMGSGWEDDYQYTISMSPEMFCSFVREEIVVDKSESDRWQDLLAKTP